jgi:hypothetical protein
MNSPAPAVIATLRNWRRVAMMHLLVQISPEKKLETKTGLRTIRKVGYASGSSRRMGVQVCAPGITAPLPGLRQLDIGAVKTGSWGSQCSVAVFELFEFIS